MGHYGDRGGDDGGIVCGIHIALAQGRQEGGKTVKKTICLLLAMISIMVLMGGCENVDP